MNDLVKITENQDGVIDAVDQRWCATVFTDTNRTVCGSTLDAASHYVAESKLVHRGGITCEKCLSVIREIKRIKL